MAENPTAKAGSPQRTAVGIQLRKQTSSSPLHPNFHMPEPKRQLDTVVKLGLFVFVASFTLIGGGMYLTRPDRSIPPYSIGSQAGTAVAVHVPVYTSDSAIETLIERFGKVGRETRDFGKMKIQPTTPGDPRGRYVKISVYVFTHEAWAEPAMLHKYLASVTGESPDPSLKETFEKTVRGFYRLDETEEEGRVGPLLSVKDSAGTAAYSRLLFKGPVVLAGGKSPAPAAPSAPTPLTSETPGASVKGDP